MSERYADEEGYGSLHIGYKYKVYQAMTGSLKTEWIQPEPTILTGTKSTSEITSNLPACGRQNVIRMIHHG